LDQGGTESSVALKRLTDRVKAGQCILFLGAGVHAPPPNDSLYKYPEEQRLPLGRHLSELLAEKYDFETRFPGESPCDLQRVSLYVETTDGLGLNALSEFMRAQLTAGRRPSPALRMLAELPFRIIVTTNYDRMLESALRKCDPEKEPDVFVYDPDAVEPTPDTRDDPTAERPLVFKMHGDIEDGGSMVITDEHYITFVQRMSDKEALHPVPQTVRYRMRQWPTLFVGYSLRDYNLRLLFRTLRWRIDTAEIPTSFSVDRNPDPLVLKVLQDKLKFVTFVAQDLWTFVPWLYKEVRGREYPG
jgi:SIR2-like protein